jgi:preprotein translocase subunit SecG
MTLFEILILIALAVLIVLTAIVLLRHRSGPGDAQTLDLLALQNFCNRRSNSKC